MWSASSSPIVRDATVEPEDVAACAAAVADPNSDVTLASVVEDLSPALNHQEAVGRRAGLDFLAGVLAGVPEDSLAAEDCSLLVKFLSSRLRDRALMYSPTIRAMRALAVRQAGSLSDEDLVKITWTLLDDVQTQSFVVSDRRCVYDVVLGRVVLCRLDLFSSAPAAVSERFLLGLLQCVEGETNAGCLYLIFSAWPVVLRRLDAVSNLVEDCFEALACYFPVDFKGSQDGVTRDALSEKLKEALVALPAFGKLALPLFLDKLDSDVVSSKVESLVCLRAGLDAFPTRCYELHFKAVWADCKQEIMGIRETTSKAVVRQAYGLLEDVTEHVFAASGFPASAERWIEVVWHDLKPFLGFVESGLMTTGVEVLAAVAGAADGAAEILLARALPALAQVYARPESDTLQVSRCICRVLSAREGAVLDTTSWPVSRLLEIGKEVLLTEGGCNSDLANAWGGILVWLRRRRARPTEAVNELVASVFRREVTGNNCMGLDERKALALEMLEVGPAELKRWCDEAVDSASGDATEILASLCAKSAEVFREYLPRMVKTASFPLGSLTAVWDSRDEEAASAEELLQDFVAEELVQKCFTSSSEEDAAAKILLRKVGRRCEGERGVNLAKRVLGEFLSAERPAELRERSSAFLCSLPRATARVLDDGWAKLLSAEVGDCGQEVMKLAGSVANKVPSARELCRALMGRPGSCWVLRGLLMRGCGAEEETREFFDRCDGLDTAELSFEVAAVVRRDDDDLCAANHHAVLPFYRQRFLQKCVAHFTERFGSTGQAKHLEAVVHLLPHVPAASARASVTPLMPLFAKTLSSPSSAQSGEVASAFLKFVSGLEPAAVGDMAEELLPFLLSSAARTDLGVSARASSLEAAEAAASPSLKNLKELKSMVVKSTATLLDDKKRLIRRAAADARNAWLLL